MASSLYDITVAPYQQVVDAMVGILDKGAEHANELGIDLDELVNFSLYEDMLPFGFQVFATALHSVGALQAIESGVFNRPESLPQHDYAGLQNLMAETAATLGSYSREQVDAMSGGEVLFAAGELQLPFTTEGYVMSFSLPNFYFHATTTYDILRLKGVPLGKMNFLGSMQLKK
ncbi:MAG: DUF1993 domain-containing protein [Gammaproteobacteria bacterium]|nr:MAG: DUF1993 domain-containing protein [Gammaproteobacteria bacterium]RLA11779.1 MAG: DUF1993 domain-containing protein [Gammaproteobacteria bacterium]